MKNARGRTYVTGGAAGLSAGCSPCLVRLPHDCGDAMPEWTGSSHGVLGYPHEVRMAR